MPLPRRRLAWILGLAVAAAIPFIPDPPQPTERSWDQDVDLVRSAQVRYRGITASFEEVARAYALKAFEEAELAGWSARAHPRYPDTEALVRVRFRVGAARPDSTDNGRRSADLRRAVAGTLDLTWRLNTLAAVQVQAHDDYAHDALAVFQQTVDGLLDRMVYVLEATDLRDAPDGVVTSRLEAGTVLMREDETGAWARVRVPSDTAGGWIQSTHLRPVSPTARRD